LAKKFLFREPDPGDGAGDPAGEEIAAAVEDFGIGERGAGDFLAAEEAYNLNVFLKQLHKVQRVAGHHTRGRVC